jgi:hypothetical protein
LENTWSKQVLWKLSSKQVYNSQHILMLMWFIFKFAPSSFTHVIHYLSSHIDPTIELGFLPRLDYLTSNDLIVICLNYQSIFKKLIIKAKTSCVPLHIHKSKLAIR